MPQENRQSQHSDSRFGLYSGDDLLNLPEQRYKTLIDRVLYEGDHTMIIGVEGIGKSILTLQMACCLSCGDDFMDSFEVPSPVSTLYVQTEGQLATTQERLRRMCLGISVNLQMFHVHYMPGMELDHTQGLLRFTRAIDDGIEAGMTKPRVIFIDPVYSAMKGDLSDNQAVRAFIHNIRVVADTYDCAIVLIHHERKGKRDYRGQIVQEAGREVVLGSATFNAAIDTGFRLQGVTNMRLTRWKDRNDRCTPEIELSRIDNPLMFVVPTGESTASYESVFFHVKHYHMETVEHITIAELTERTRLGRDCVNKALRYWRNLGVVKRASHGHPARFMLTEAGERRDTHS